MLRKMLKSKIQYAKITAKNLKYTGSITIDRSLMDKADLYAGEMVLIANLNNGARFETYVIEGKRGSGVIGLNGAAARLGEIGDELIIMSYLFVDDVSAKKCEPVLLFLNNNNRPGK